MAIQQVARASGGKPWRVEFRNLREMRIRFRDIGRLLAAEGLEEKSAAFKTAERQLNGEMADIARDLRDRIRSNAEAAGAPRRVQKSVFAFSDMNAPRRKAAQRSALVGVRKGAPPRKDASLYKEWGVGKARRKDGTIAAKGVGMSLAAMFEHGTRGRIQARYYFTSAYYGMRNIILSRLTAAYKNALESLKETP